MNKRKLSIIAGVLIIIGIVGSLLTYRIIDPEPISEEKVIDHKQVSSIDIDTDNIGVNILPTTDDSIKVTLEGETSTNIIRSFTTDIEDSTLFITYHEEQRSWFNFDIFNVLKPLKINVYLPQKQYDSLNVSANNGRVSIEKLNSKRMELHSNNGRVELNEVHSPTIIAETNNGRINMKEIIAQTISVESRNGRVTLDRVEGDVKAETRNGGISLITQDLDRNINLISHNGKITIKTEEKPTNVRFNVSVHNGNVNILDKYQGSTTIGNGENLVELTTHNGSISVTE